jgi:diaminopimelate decarboxylase
VHPFLATGVGRSKFGVDGTQLPRLLATMRQCSSHVTLAGLHCHLGSTITNVHIFRSLSSQYFSEHLVKVYKKWNVLVTVYNY